MEITGLLGGLQGLYVYSAYSAPDPASSASQFGIRGLGFRGQP